MASIPPLLFLTLCFTVGILITFPDQSRDNPLIPLVVPAFLFTFFSAILLLILHVAVPQSVYTKHLAMATQAVTFTTLFLGAAAVVLPALTTVVIPDTVKPAVEGTVLLIVCVFFAKSLDLPIYLPKGGFVPAFPILCISTGILLLIDQIVSFSFHNWTNSISNILFHLLLFCDFNLAMVLLLVRVSATSDGLQRLISGVMMERLVMMTIAMSFTTALIGVHMMVALVV
jgi:hypothetical protein